MRQPQTCHRYLTDQIPPRFPTLAVPFNASSLTSILFGVVSQGSAIFMRIGHINNRLTIVSLFEQISNPWPGYFFRALTAAQRFRIASAIRLRASADILLLFTGPPPIGVFLLPGGLPRRLPGAEVPPLMPSRACIAASSLFRSALSCPTISAMFMGQILYRVSLFSLSSRSTR